MPKNRLHHQTWESRQNRDLRRGLRISNAARNQILTVIINVKKDLA